MLFTGTNFSQKKVQRERNIGLILRIFFRNHFDNRRQPDS